MHMMKDSSLSGEIKPAATMLQRAQCTTLYSTGVVQYFYKTMRSLTSLRVTSQAIAADQQ
jgi:hypothetical protein